MPKLVKNNPNDTTGGGGCLCHPIKATDTVGPFVVFEATETDSNLSPYAVLCAECFDQCKKLFEDGDELAGGENSPVEVPEL